MERRGVNIKGRGGKRLEMEEKRSWKHNDYPGNGRQEKVKNSGNRKIQMKKKQLNRERNEISNGEMSRYSSIQEDGKTWNMRQEKEKERTKEMYK